ncbi:putative protein OS=Streptomyces microflavus OX=1919 GN=Smic_81430 PE=4 SV=1 [Streptomyces microflavus]
MSGAELPEDALARMLNAHAARWRRETATYGYEVKGNLQAREERSWRREWAEENAYDFGSSTVNAGVSSISPPQ